MEKRVIFYGAGKIGKMLLEFLKRLKVEAVLDSFCDTDPRKTNTYIDNIRVTSYEQAKEKDLPFVITVGVNYIDEIKKKLESDKKEIFDIMTFLIQECGLDPVEVNREYCALYHIEAMDAYFEEAESDSAINIFWDNESPFYRMFKRLNTDNIVELACGRGRHVEHYYNQASKITLVDILDKNIEICKKRFSDKNKISYYVNNGYDLHDLKDESYTALFSYDSMVHFEMFDVFSYLKETHRILIKGGMALLHHSNIAKLPDQSFGNSGNRGSRNFMSKELFAYLADKAGFEIVEQLVIDWSEPDMDCVSLLKKR